MKAKKGKQLAQELIADLLGGEDKASKEPTLVVQEEAEPVVGSAARRLGRRLSTGAVLGSPEAALAQSENLRFAQQKILDLEEEMERLRHENESLAAAADTLRKRADELLAETETKKVQYTEAQESFEGERELLQKSLKSHAREIHDFKIKEEEYERRLTTNIQKIRVRERELENRLEMVKVESGALVRAKDEMILDLKRQLDQMNHELENYRTKSTELNRQLGDKQNVLRRTVKALRIALSMLEGHRSTGDDDSEKPKG